MREIFIKDWNKSSERRLVGVFREIPQQQEKCTFDEFPT